MPQFFVGWQTWEMLSFCLGCAIVLVFAFGLARLWYTNRKIERLELIDEERRVRLAEMRHCGIPTRSDNDIPFGVRAIQSGIEVEGIWISRTNTPVASKRASVATLVADSGDSAKGKGKARAVDTSFEEPRRLHSMTFAGPSTEQVMNSSPLARSMAVTSEYTHQQQQQHQHQDGAAEELDPFVANTRLPASSRPGSTISGLTGAEQYYDIAINRPHNPAELSSHARPDSWEVGAHISQQYDGSGYDSGSPQGRNGSGYAKLQMQQQHQQPQPQQYMR